MTPLDGPAHSIGDIVTVFHHTDRSTQFRVVGWRCPDPAEYYLDREGTVRFETGRFLTLFNSDKLDPKSKRYIVEEVFGPHGPSKFDAGY